ncbi:hypothetical protein [Arthrobacter sp. 24S4-2]|nr:hypothetical protein [Arthrobacter sp. 24S4-2]
MLKPRYVKDWTPLAGGFVEIRIQGQLVDNGFLQAASSPTKPLKKA